MSYGTAYERWAGVGPYYAMFPTDFVNQVVLSYTKPGQRILDPFAGRASSIFAGATHGRPSIGIEINPVGWIYGKTKLSPAPADAVIARVDEIAKIADGFSRDMGRELPRFFDFCFSRPSLRFLLAARENLDWKRTKVDCTLMALILVDLHGVRERSFSNQMRQSKAMSPEYSIRWWRRHDLKPPRIDPREFLRKKIQWRYAKGIAEITQSNVFLGDSCQLLKKVKSQMITEKQKPFKLLFTSPPYIGISDYHRDQWLRLWMLGGEPNIERTGQKHRGMFSSHVAYAELLNNVFSQCADLMSPSGIVYVRIDARKVTFDIARDVLHLAFPHWSEKIIRRPFLKQTQTALFGDKDDKPGEKDIILTGPRAQ
jgi:DNA methylase